MKEVLEYFLIDNISGKKSTEKWLSKNNNQLYTLIVNRCVDNKLEYFTFQK